MACPCGTKFCYLCGEAINARRPYDHFKDGHLGGGKDSAASRCTVYGTPDWAQRSASDARDKAKAALQEYLKSNPELRGLGGERLQGIRRQVMGATELPTPARKRRRLDA